MSINKNKQYSNARKYRPDSNVISLKKQTLLTTAIADVYSENIRKILTLE